MKFLRGLLIFLLISFAIYCIVMLFLPSDYTLERKVTIEAKPTKVYNAILDFEGWDNWSYWHKIDSTNVVKVFGTKGEVGSGYSWKGETTMEGTFTVAELKPDERIDFDMMFNGQDPAKGYFTLVPIDEDETEVTYAFVSHFSFLGRVQKAFIDIFIGEAYEKSLADLKSYVEGMPDEAPMEFNVELVTVESIPYYSVTDSLMIADMSSKFLEERYDEIMGFLKEDTTNISAPPFSLYPVWDMESGKAVVEVAIAANSSKMPNQRIKKNNTYAGEALKVAFYGPYEATGAAHEAIYQYAAENNYEIIGAPYEVYVTDPSTEPDPSKWLTEIYYPVRAKEMNEEAPEEAEM